MELSLLTLRSSVWSKGASTSLMFLWVARLVKLIHMPRGPSRFLTPRCPAMFWWTPVGAWMRWKKFLKSWILSLQPCMEIWSGCPLRKAKNLCVIGTSIPLKATANTSKLWSRQWSWEAKRQESTHKGKIGKAFSRERTDAQKSARPPFGTMERTGRKTSMTGSHLEDGRPPRGRFMTSRQNTVNTPSSFASMKLIKPTWNDDYPFSLNYLYFMSIIHIPHIQNNPI